MAKESLWKRYLYLWVHGDLRYIKHGIPAYGACEYIYNNIEIILEDKGFLDNIDIYILRSVTNIKNNKGLAIIHQNQYRDVWVLNGVSKMVIRGHL